jgi:hypothetical protein
MANFRLFAENGNRKQKFVCFGWQSKTVTGDYFFSKRAHLWVSVCVKDSQFSSTR